MTTVDVSKKGKTVKTIKLPNVVVMTLILSAFGAAAGAGAGIIMGTAMDIKELVHKVTR